MTNGFEFAAMAHLAQDLPFYIPHNMQLTSERIPQWKYNQHQHQFSPQDLQQMAMINLADHHQKQQQQMASVSYLTPSIDQSHTLIENDQNVSDQQQPTVMNQNQREKRVLSDTEIELVESAEMDKDSSTRMVMGSASKKTRKALMGNRVHGTLTLNVRLL